MEQLLLMKSSTFRNCMILGLILVLPKIALPNLLPNLWSNDEAYRKAKVVDVFGKVTDIKGNALPSATILEKGTQNRVITNSEGDFTLSVDENATLVINYAGFETIEIAAKDRLFVKMRMGNNSQLIEEEVLSPSFAVISGQVTSAEDDLPIPGVNVLEKGTTNGTTTDFDGNYRIQVPENATLVFSYIGYVPQEVEVGNRTKLDVVLETDLAQLEEVVVVGYGVSDKSDITGAVSSINSKEIQDLPNANVLDMAQGRIAGLTVANSSAAPGQNPSLLIRGKNSITANNDPLIILDGIPYTGSFSSIPAADIESFNVLKDASATAIYGSRGSNGVIIITTKQGNSGKISVNYSGRVGVNTSISKIDVLSAEEYVDLRQHYGQIQASEQQNLDNGNETDWQDEAFQSGFQQEHSLNVSGGSENSTHYLSLSHFDQEGIIRGSEYERTTIRLNSSFNLTDWLEVGTNIQATDEDFGDQGAINMSNLIRMSPLASPYDANGDITLFPIPEDPFFTNPLDALNTKDERVQRTLITNLFSELKIPFIEGLSYRFNYGRTEIRNNRNIYLPINSALGQNTTGFAERINSIGINNTIENILYYNASFGKSEIGLTALYSYQETVNEATNVNGSGFLNDILQDYGVGTGNILTTATPFTESVITSQMGRLNYTYDSRYNLTFTIRRDGFSGFAENSKHGTFPSVAVGWVISEEAFAQEIPWIGFLKLRASYGVNGNQAIAPYRTLTQITGSPNFNYYFDDTAIGFAPTSLGNPNLGWEQTTSFNVGLDYGLLNGRLSGSLEYYISNSDDLLLTRLLNSTQGFSSILQNIGKTRNTGIELNINGVLIDNSKFSWDIAANLFSNRNEIVQLFDEETDDVGNGWFIGEDIDANFNYIIDGVWGTQSEIDGSHMPGAIPGSLNLRDTNNDGLINDNDRVIQGSISPDYTLGITNTFNYSNFSLSIFMYTVQGVLAHNNARIPGNWLGDRVNYQDVDYWTPDNTDASAPAVNYENSFGVQFFEDKSFLRIKNVTLGYSFDQELLNRLKISSLRLYVTTNNLITITDWGGYDPETIATDNLGVSIDAYPAFRTTMFGLEVGF